MAEDSHSAHGLDDEAREEVRRRFEKSRLAWSEPSQDASVELRIDADAMAVYADFSPAAPGRSVLTVDDVSRALSESEVVSGIDWDTIAIATDKCNLDAVELTMVRIATGSKPVHGRPEHLLPDQEVLPGPTYPQPRADGSVDFREISPFRIVTAGQRIGTFVAAREGVEGMDVYGRAIPCVDEQIEHYSAGENTARSGDELQAALDGRVELEGTTIGVNPVLIVDSDVDYHTGHIDFPGDVYVSGQVHDGFKVHAEGSIYAGSPLDATDMVAGGDLTAGHGLMGRNDGTIRIGGTLRAKYVENCLIEAGSDVFVERGIMRSHVYTSGMVATSERGMILGGLIFAQNGVQTRQVGTATGPPVAIHCGVDYLAEQKLDILRAKAERITLKLQEVRRMRAHSTSPDLERMLEELKADLRATNEASETLLFELDRNEQVQISASGTVFPGTSIEICHVSCTVERELHAVVFRLDKDSGHITIEKLDRQ
jgi:uncharacterized protein (DUF342 family)